MNANTAVCPGVCPTPPLSCGAYLGACLVPGLRSLRLSANRHQAICPLAFHPNTAAGLHPSSSHLEEEQRPPLLTLSLAAEGRLGSLGNPLGLREERKMEEAARSPPRGRQLLPLVLSVDEILRSSSRHVLSSCKCQALDQALGTRE